MPRIGLLTAGADCPGLNAAIRAVVGRALLSGNTVVGLMNGWSGLLTLDARVLDERTVREILPLGGTILGAGRPQYLRESEQREALVAAFQTLGLEALVVIGDSAGLAVGHVLAGAGLPIIGIPATMDNDVGGTDYCIGYDSAVSTVAEALDKLQTTASAHHRVMVVEVMGHAAGWVAAAGAICGSAHLLVIPEVATHIDEIVQLLHRRHDHGRGFTIVVVAEGAQIDGITAPDEADDLPVALRRHRPSIGELTGLEIEMRSGYETRVTVLGHLQRGGSPTVYDRLMATRFGAAAVDLIVERQWDHLVALKGSRLVPVPLAEVTAHRPADAALYDLAMLFSD